MDSLIRQMRGKYSGAQEKTREAGRPTGDKRIPPRKSISFKEDKKKATNWFQRQFSRQMSGRDYDPIREMDHTTAVAAAAYAITSLEETRQEKHTGYDPETPLTRPRSRREATFPMQEPRSSSKRFSGQGSTKESEIQDEKLPEPKSPAKKAPERAPSIRKSPTFGIKLRGSSIKRTEDSEEIPPKPVSPAPRRPVPPPRTRSERDFLPKPPPPPPQIKGWSSSHREAAADDWEKTELAKVKERHEKLNRKIDSWEAKKVTKAREKLKRTQREIERKRTRASQKFREDMEYIDQIARGARAQAEERRRSEEVKVKEKADVFRRTGKLPATTCLCF